MKSDRRKFLKLSGLGLAGAGLLNGTGVSGQGAQGHRQVFNMSGYAAPKMDKVRIGFVGLGNRGPDAVQRMIHIEGVEVKALCDIRPERVKYVQTFLNGSSHSPKVFSGGTDDWKKMCELPDIDLIYIATPWSLHAPMAAYAMEHGKHACVEVPAAKTLDECWQLVETSERTRKHCMILENCCYDFFELLVLNLVRQGLMGEIVHGEGAYIHDLLEGNFSKDKYYDQWRLKENFRNGNLYPTHGLGPVAQVMDLNRGDKMDYLVSLSGNDFVMAAEAGKRASTDPFYQPYVGKKFRGNMNTTIIRTENGRTIMLQHDVTSPNVYSRIYKISGTKGSALKYPLSPRLSLGTEDWMGEEELQNTGKTYSPPIVTRIGEMAKKLGGHGGMDFLMDWRTIDCLRNGLALDIDVYDAALWSSIAPLSEWSVANRSQPVSVPDFTGGSWKSNLRVDVTLGKGGTTKVLI